MKPPKSELYQIAQESGLLTATEETGKQVVKFIEFIQVEIPDIDRTTATLLAGYYIHRLPALLVENPMAMEQLKAYANKITES